MYGLERERGGLVELTSCEGRCWPAAGLSENCREKSARKGQRLIRKELPHDRPFDQESLDLVIVYGFETIGPLAFERV